MPHRPPDFNNFPRNAASRGTPNGPLADPGAEHYRVNDSPRPERKKAGDDAPHSAQTAASSYMTGRPQLNMR
jgi:hypothetical protein